jgi:hypothetical protein
MSRSDTLERAAGLPPLLVHIIKSALHAATNDPHYDRIGDAEALVECGELAALIVPARGVLAPADDDLYKAIEAIAVAHLGFGEVRTALREALQRVEKFEERDPIATAVNDARPSIEATYYYVGLACGITFATLGRYDVVPVVAPARGVQDRSVGISRRARRRRR